LPVLADCYRALGRYSAVERVWLEIREISPAHEILSEGKIVAAGALADTDDLRGAIELLTPKRPPKRVRDHHLREWYVLGDLYDRLGDPIAARRWFDNVASNDRDFADVDERLRALGR
jgi:tetratricopeptide (TPR) repeat protein